MDAARIEEGLHIVDDDEDGRDPDAVAAEEGAPQLDGRGDGELEDLCDAFVAGFNGRDLEAVLGIVRHDVETPDIAGADGAETLAEELEAIWERSPEAFLTRGFLDEVPVAVAWRPDEEGCWTRVALVCFDADHGLLSLVAVPDDADALDRTIAEEPTDTDLEEWNDWAGWDRGEETVAPDRGRSRP